jgi:hypothetical protein
MYDEKRRQRSCEKRVRLSSPQNTKQGPCVRLRRQTVCVCACRDRVKGWGEGLGLDDSTFFLCMILSWSFLS